LLVVVALLAGGAFVGSLGTVVFTSYRFNEIDHRNAERFSDLSSQYAIAEREARVLQERIKDMEVELIRAGIKLNDH
jgi:hypothetical protein